MAHTAMGRRVGTSCTLSLLLSDSSERVQLQGTEQQSTSYGRAHSSVGSLGGHSSAAATAQPQSRSEVRGRPPLAASCSCSASSCATVRAGRGGGATYAAPVAVVICTSGTWARGTATDTGAGWARPLVTAAVGGAATLGAGAGAAAGGSSAASCLIQGENLRRSCVHNAVMHREMNLNGC